LHNLDFQLDHVFLDCELYNERGERVIHTKTKFISKGFTLKKQSNVVFKYVLMEPRLAPGQYTLALYMYSDFGKLLWVEGIKACKVNSKDPSGRNEYLDTVIAAVVPEYSLELDMNVD